LITRLWRAGIDAAAASLFPLPSMTTSMDQPGPRTFSLPNLLTYGRVAAVPVVAGLLFWPLDDWARWTALAVFALAAITDFLDGYLARVWSQQSSLGRMLDPIADKLLVAVCLLMLAVDEAITGVNLWAAIIILSREILVSGLREFLAELRASVPVTRVAKYKTALQLLALGFLIAPPRGVSFLDTATIGLALLWAAALLTLYTGYDYMRASMKHITDK
jgi:cardiolipin synthase (CMP-forming)